MSHHQSKPFTTTVQYKQARKAGQRRKRELVETQHYRLAEAEYREHTFGQMGGRR
ncbi:hypothetical protein IVIADoCa7_12 [Xanthomonas phage vB_Xar_IVIA-DoCa7]|uniref:Uncharacterized protein n=1 Tax=Xanthomonas phage vB_Xar_IVIA-DoCa7 TaxID=2975534 RepID=A0A9X9JN75_9CAUD|nr:hypothetical protein IVIADoCa7_12 [Xanthomonas phage vB_Xar_IVIA-DoCa7]